MNKYQIIIETAGGRIWKKQIEAQTANIISFMQVVMQNWTQDETIGPDEIIKIGRTYFRLSTIQVLQVRYIPPVLSSMYIPYKLGLIDTTIAYQ